MSPFKSAGAVSSVDYWQASCAHQPAGFVLFVQACSAVTWRLMATHSILLFPLHFSRASPCAITFQLDSNTEALSWNHCCSGKSTRITYSECVLVALVIQHAMRMRHIFICGLCGSTIFFPYYHINATIFGKNVLNTKCVFWFYLQLLSETFLILRRTERDMIKNLYRSSCKVTVILVRL